jgi:hypothetical protein
MGSLSSTTPTDLTRVFQPATEFKNNPVPLISLNQTASNPSEKSTTVELPTFNINLSSLGAQPSSTNLVTPKPSNARSVATQPQKAEKPWWQAAWQGVQQWVQAPNSEKIAQIQQKAVETVAAVTNTSQETPKAETKTVAANPAATPEKKSGNLWDGIKNFFTDKSKDIAQENKPTEKASQPKETQTAQVQQEIKQAQQIVASYQSQVNAGKSLTSSDRGKLEGALQLLSQAQFNFNFSGNGFEMDSGYGKLGSLKNEIASQLKHQQTSDPTKIAFQLNTSTPVS